jgi:hypothetical protein
MSILITPILQHPIIMWHIINLRKIQKIKMRTTISDQNQEKKKKPSWPNPCRGSAGLATPMSLVWQHP